MWSERRRALALLVGGAVAGLAPAACGFRPLHKPQNGKGGITDLSFVKVDRIEDRAGQLVRNELLEWLNPRRLDVRPVYLLQVDLSESKEGLAFQKDDSVTRYNLRLGGSFRLHDQRVGSVVLEGLTRSTAAYNVVQSDYANLIAERDARMRAARNVAQDIATRLSIYFNRLRSAEEG